MANARLSRQQVEVIGNLATNLRVGGQSLMVAGAAQNGNLRVHGVTLEYMTKISPEEPSSDIGIGQSVALSVVRNLSVNSTITVGQGLESNYIFESASSTIGVDDSLSLNQTLNKTLTSTLTLDHSISLALVKTASSTVGIGQSVNVSVVRNVSAGSTLSLQQLGFAASHPFPSSTIGIEHSVNVRKILNRSINQTIDVSQDQERFGTTRAGAFSVLTGESWVWDPLLSAYRSVAVTMTSTASAELIQGPTQIYVEAGNILTLSQSVSTQNVFYRAPVSNISLAHTNSYTNFKQDVIYIYSPFVGSTTDPNLPTPPPITQP